MQTENPPSRFFYCFLVLYNNNLGKSHHPSYNLMRKTYSMKNYFSLYSLQNDK